MMILVLPVKRRSEKVLNPMPAAKRSVWALVVGNFIMWTYIYSVNQTQVQRTLTLPSLADVKK